MSRSSLKEYEERVLEVLHFNPLINVSAVSRKTGLPDYTVRRVVRRLRDRKLIAFRAMVNVYALGFTQYAVFASLASAGEKVHTQFREKLIRSEEVSFVCEMGGEYQYAITICARSAQQALAFLGKLSKQFGAALNEHAFSIQTRLFDFPCKFLLPKVERSQGCSWGVTEKTRSFDQTDHRILSSMSHLNEYSLTEISRASGVAISSVDYRLSKLESDGVVSGYFYEIKTEKFGFHPYLLTVYTRGVDPLLTRRMTDFCRTEDSVRIMVENLGAWDYELGIEVRNPRDASVVAQKLHEHFRDEIRSVRILPVLSYLKVANYPFKNFPA